MPIGSFRTGPTAHERPPELIAAAVHVFTREGYPLAKMRDVAAEMGLSEAAIHRYTGSKEDLFVPAIRHSLPLEDMPAGDLPMSPSPLAATVWEAREFVAEALNAGIRAPVLAALIKHLASRAEAGTLRRTPDTAVDALVHALFPASAVAAGGR